MNAFDAISLKDLGKEYESLTYLGEATLPDEKFNSVAVLHSSDGAKAHLISEIKGIKIVVAPDFLGARSLVKKIGSWGNKVAYLPYKDDSLILRRGTSNSNTIERIITLTRLAYDKVDCIVTCADSLLQEFPSLDLVKKYSLKLKVEDELPLDKLSTQLALMGYLRNDEVANAGEYSLKGDILSIYSIDGEFYRVSFFDDLVESISSIDLESMTKLVDLNEIIVPPTSDVLLDEKSASVVKKELQRNISNKNAQTLMNDPREGANNEGVNWALVYAKSCTVPLLNLIETKGYPTLILDEPKLIKEKLEVIRKEFENRYKTLLDGGEVLYPHRLACLLLNDAKDLINKHRRVSFSTLLNNNPFYDPKVLINCVSRPVTKYCLDPHSLQADLKGFLINNTKVIICCGKEDKAKALIESLRRDDVPAKYSEDGIADDGIIVTPLGVEVGVIYPGAKVCVIGLLEISGRGVKETSKKPKKDFIIPKAGDYVVHKVHGIGLCEGTVIMKTGEFDKEYIILKYRDGDKLFVATDQMDNLQKFIGEEHPKLNKLGGKDFEKEKTKVRASVKKLAFSLIEVYAKREKLDGFKYEKDTVWQKEFEDAFPYEETEDQLKAICDIKTDMEKGKVMDRLIVGDVGFGKTEVAFRAMFKTVIQNKQAILLAPTTILARQHFELLEDRLKPFGIKCGLLTRLQSNKENQDTLSELKNGTMHMVVATHRVLNSSVEFNDLGLLVLDEEQRFGVEQKEKLKAKFPKINVLSLSATPIPRTLNMSLTGIRDISMLETPPKGRIPIQTYVTEYSDTLVQDAIKREYERGGQVLILLNDIERLDAYANDLSTLCPGIKFITANGQMNPSDLEKRISAFYDKKFDVLLATTIIENGIDIPDANTLIVIDSDRFGLSQLYQLRGRVGRRGILAHAYFTVQDHKIISETAQKRLQTLLDNTEIGSGFKVALSDLTIRGAGSLLGAEQSGHIEKVGYEMYLELLNDAIEEIQTGVEKKDKINVEMKVDAPAFIKEGFVSSRDKLRIYKQISSVSSASEKEDLIKELENVYGKVDQPLINLINISLLKNIVSNYNVTKVIINRNGSAVYFLDAEIFKNEELMATVSNRFEDVVLSPAIPPSLIFNKKYYKPEDRINQVLEFFMNIKM